MLVISRKRKESLVIGNNIRITITKFDSCKVSIGIEAPRNVTVLRSEIIEQAKKNGKTTKLESAK